MEDLLGAYSVFFDLAYQTAWRRYTHRKFWNVIIHFVSSWLLTRPLFSLAAMFFPSFVNIFLILLHVTVCLIQDIKLGGVYAVLYLMAAYHGLNVETSFTGAAILLLIVAAFQGVVGHLIIERNELALPTTQGDVVLLVCNIVNDFFVAPFHFSVLLLMRANLLPELQWKSDVALKKVFEQYSGEKSP